MIVAAGAVGIVALAAYVRTVFVHPEPEVPPATVGVPRLAVLPFENLSPDPEQEYFASGIQEDILNEIARSTDVRVIGRSSVARYRDGELPVSRVAAELGVDHVLEGSIRYAEGKVRVSARLLDGDTGVQLWSRSYDRDFAHIFEIQSDIARRIAGALRVAMRPTVVVPANAARVKAYEEYLVARNFRERVFVSGWGPIIEHTRQALAADPDFIPALWMLHNAYQNRIIGDSDADALAQMRALTARAQQEDPNHPLTLSLMAKDAGFAWRWDAAASLWSAAVAADPTDPFLLGSAAFAALGAGDPAAALAFADQGIDSDPDHDWPRYARMTVLRAMGEIGAARHEAELVFALHGDRAFPAAMTQALAAAMQSDVDRVRRYADFMVATVGEPMAPFREFLLGVAVGRPELSLLNATIERIPVPNANKWMVVQSRISAGDLDGALSSLDDVARSHAMYSVIRIVTDPAFAPLRPDPRYRSFLKSVGLQGGDAEPG
jgi:TolB-like protein